MMNNLFANFLLIIFLAAILGGAAFYLLRAKKKGIKCVGCPYAKECGAAKCAHAKQA